MLEDIPLSKQAKSAEQIPINVYETAGRYQLGTPLVQYKTIALRFWLVFFPLLFLIGVFSLVESIHEYNRLRDQQAQVRDCQCFVTAKQRTAQKEMVQDYDHFLHDQQMDIMGCITRLFAPAAFSVGLYLTRKKRLYVCSDGLLFTNGKKEEAIRWDEVKEFRESEVRRADGSIFTLGRIWLMSKSGDFNKRVEAAVIPLLLQPAIAQYEQGEPVSFGTLCVDHTGISNGKQVISWASLQDVRFENSKLHVKYDGKWQRLSVPIVKTPNIVVFVALVKHVLVKRAGA